MAVGRGAALAVCQERMLVGVKINKYNTPAVQLRSQAVSGASK